MNATDTAHGRLADDEVIEASPRSFGLVFSGVFLVVALLPVWRGQPLRVWSLVVAVTFLVLAVARPRVLAPLSGIWQRVGMVLHHIVNPIVMAMLFYVVVTPFGVVVRQFGKGLHTDLRPDPGASSYWRHRKAAPIDMRKQF